MSCRGLWSLVCLIAGAVQTANAEKLTVFIGTYTAPGRSEGIYSCGFDPATGAVDGLKLAAKAVSPSFLAIHPNHRFLYAVSEVSVFEGKDAGCVIAYRINPATATLEEINRVSSGGAGPCHVAVDATGKLVAVANYGGGSLASMAVNADGSLTAPVATLRRTGSGPNHSRQEASHAHCVVMTPDNRRLLAADLGADEVVAMDLVLSPGTRAANPPNLTGALADVRLSAAEGAIVGPKSTLHLPGGSGPRHLAFVGADRFFVADEMLSTVAACTYSAESGALTLGKILPMLPADFTGQSTAAEIVAHPNRRFIYASNRGHDSVAVYRVAGGVFEPVEISKLPVRTPRNIAIDPSGKWLWASGQDSDRIAILGVDRGTGRLKAEAASVSVAAPVCVVFAAGR